MAKRELRLSKPEQPDTPVTGWCAVGFGLLGVFTWGMVFTPIGLVFSVLALLFGQFSWDIAGMILAVIGFFTSIPLLLFFGLGAVAAMLPWSG